MLKRSVLFLMAMLVAGCAFKSPAGTPQEGDVEEIAISGEGMDPPLTLSFQDLMKTNDETWTRSSVVNFPIHVPESLNFSIKFKLDPEELSGARVTAEATSGMDLKKYEFQVSGIEAAPDGKDTTISFDIANPRTILGTSEEYRVYLSIKIEFAKGPKEIVLPIATPPSRIALTSRQFALGRNSDSAEGSLPQVLKSQAETRELVEEVTLKNESFETVSLKLPFRTQGALRREGIRYWTEEAPSDNPHAKNHIQQQKDDVSEMTEDFYIFPESADLDSVWTSYSQAALNDVRIAPGQSLRVGLYAGGMLSQDLGEVPSSTAADVQQSVGARAICPAGAMQWVPPKSPEYCNAVAHILGFPDDTVDLCIQSADAMRRCQYLHGDVDVCNHAAELDEQLDKRRMPHPDNRIPWPIYFGCKAMHLNSESRIDYIALGWKWQPINASFKEGLTTGPLKIYWPDQAISIYGRFASGLPNADYQWREFPLFESGHQIAE